MMQENLILVWFLFAVVNCTMVYIGLKTKKVNAIINNSILNREFMIRCLYIVAILLGPVFFIYKLITDLEKIAKK